MHGILMIVVPIVTSENCNYYFKGKHVFKNLCPALEDSSLKEKHCWTHSNLIKMKTISNHAVNIVQLIWFQVEICTQL